MIGAFSVHLCEYFEFRLLLWFLEFSLSLSENKTFDPGFVIFMNFVRSIRAVDIKNIIPFKMLAVPVRE